jgi:phosphoribosylformimino-5-aminoimidazole carboxamide ribotide isomerase
MPRFSIVPVLDLKGGFVVHARAGDRARYRPIRSSLAQGSNVFAIADALVALTGCRSLYIADLDAIEGAGDHGDMIARLAEHRPEVELWVDQGITSPAAAMALARDDGVIPVVGSESLGDAAMASDVLAQLGPRGCVLSLDYREERFLGPPALEARAELWPDRVIVMTLSRVGTNAGPDIERLCRTRERANARRIFAAGGVRDRADIDRLVASGIAGALVATALHDGRLTHEALADFAGER